MFQSLFSWNSPSDFELTGSKTPCIGVFQSLFSWNSPSDKCNWRLIGEVYSVSILVFLELALGLLELLPKLEGSICFNPCFLGTRPRTHGERVLQPAEVGVSILVFLELALGLSWLVAFMAKYLRFNPCFLGTRPRTAAFFRPFPRFSLSNRPFHTLL